MVRRIAFAIVLSSAVLAGPSPAASASVGSTQQWVSNYASNDASAGNVAVSPDGSTIYVTGAVNCNRNCDYATAAFDAATSAQLWLQIYKGPGHDFDYSSDIEVSPDGSKVFVTGESYGTIGRPWSLDYATIAYDAFTGAKLWVRRYDGPSHGNDRGFSVRVSPDGSKIFVIGQSWGTGTRKDWATVCYDVSTGARLWVQRYNGPANLSDLPSDLAVSPDGSTVFVTGRRNSLSVKPAFETIAYRASTGAVRWAARYNSTIGYPGYAVALAVSPDGANVLVTGPAGSGVTTIAYGAMTGVPSWIVQSDPTGSGADPYAIGVSPDGARVVVAGEAEFSGQIDYATLAYDSSTGAPLWTSYYAGSANLSDTAELLAIDPDGSTVYVTGESRESTGGRNCLLVPCSDITTVAYDMSSGATVWTDRFEGNGPTNYEYPSGIASSPDGTALYVTGTTEPLGEQVWTTIKYT